MVSAILETNPNNTGDSALGFGFNARQNSWSFERERRNGNR
jgi:hypothetical protein